jgi:hypothetical protein
MTYFTGLVMLIRRGGEHLKNDRRSFILVPRIQDDAPTNANFNDSK